MTRIPPTRGPETTANRDRTVPRWLDRKNHGKSRTCRKGNFTIIDIIGRYDGNHCLRHGIDGRCSGVKVITSKH